MVEHGPVRNEDATLSDRIERWLSDPGTHTLDDLMTAFGRQGFALVFLLLLAPSALPLPTGGATNVFEVLAVLVALQLVAGRDTLWIPRRLRATDLGGERRRRAVGRLLRFVRFLERRSRRRLRVVSALRTSNAVFGLLVVAFTVGAFLAPPFSGLDTLPSLAVVLLSLAVLLEDDLIAAVALVLGVAGVALEVTVGRAVVDAIGDLL